MITVEIFATLVIVALILFVYTFHDLQNRLYGNIISCFLCGLVCFILALFSTSGLLVIAPQQIATTLENTTGDLTTTTYSYSDPIMVQNLTLMFIFAFVAVVMLIFTGYLIYEAYEEQKQPMYAGEGDLDDD